MLEKKIRIEAGMSPEEEQDANTESRNNANKKAAANIRLFSGHNLEDFMPFL